MTAPCISKTVAEDLAHRESTEIRGIKSRLTRAANSLGAALDRWRTSKSPFVPKTKRAVGEMARDLREAINGIGTDLNVRIFHQISEFTAREGDAYDQHLGLIQENRVADRHLRIHRERAGQLWDKYTEGASEDVLAAREKALMFLMTKKEGDNVSDMVDSLPAELKDFFDGAIRAAISDMGVKLHQHDYIARETLEKFLGNYVRQQWEHAPDKAAERRAIERALGYEAGEIFGRLSALDEADIAAGKKYEPGSANPSVFGENPGRISEYRNSVNVPKGFTRKRGIQVEADADQVKKQQDIYHDISKQLDAQIKDMESRIKDLEAEKSKGLRKKKDINKEIKALEKELKVAKDEKSDTDIQAKRVIDYDTAKRAGLTTDPKKLLEVMFRETQRALNAANLMKNAIENGGKVFQSATEAKAAGFAPLESTFARDKANMSIRGGVPPIANKLMTPVGLEKIDEETGVTKPGLVIRERDGKFELISPKGVYGDTDDLISTHSTREEAKRAAKSARIYLWKPLADEINETWAQRHFLKKAFQQFTSAFAEAKTVANPGSHVRQIIGNGLFASLSGKYSINRIGGGIQGALTGRSVQPIYTLAAKAWRDLRRAEMGDDPETAALVDQAIGLDVIQRNISFYGVDDDLSTALPEDASGFAKFMSAVGEKRVFAGKASVNDYRRSMRNQWAREDASFRFAVWRDHLDRVDPRTGEKYTPEAARAEVDKILPNPDLLPPSVRKLTRNLPFTGFAFEMGRILTGHVGRAAFSIMPDERGKYDLKTTGAQRYEDAAPVIKMIGSWIALDVIANMVYQEEGYSEEEIEAIEKSAHGIRLVLPNYLGAEDETGTPMSIDLTAILPFGDWMSGVAGGGGPSEMLPWESNADYLAGSIANVAGGLTDTLLLSNPVLRTAYEISAGHTLGDFQRELSGESDTATQRMASTFMHVANNFAPNTYYFGTKKFMEYLSETEGITGDQKTTGRELATYLLGLPAVDIDPEEAMAWEYMRNKQLIRDLRSKAFRGASSHDEGAIEEATERLNLID